jgi:hypothetical protein
MSFETVRDNPRPDVFQVESTGRTDANQLRVRIRCPGCGERSQLEIFDHQPEPLVAQDREGRQRAFVVRRCSNPECFAQVFVVVDLSEPGQPVLACYPAQQLGLQTEGLPEKVETSLLEAIRCHAHQCGRLREFPSSGSAFGHGRAEGVSGGRRPS